LERLEKLKEVSGVDLLKSERLIDTMKDEFVEKDFEK
jgi:hypothetical protein